MRFIYTTPIGCRSLQKLSIAIDALAGSKGQRGLCFPGVVGAAPLRHPGYEQRTPVGVQPTSRTSRTFCPKTRSSDGNIGIGKDARSIGIGRGTKCRRPMYKRTYYVSTLYGSPGRGAARRPTRGRGGRGGGYIGHRFADDRCLWSEHPTGASRMGLPWYYTITLSLKGVTPLRYSEKVSHVTTFSSRINGFKPKACISTRKKCHTLWGADTCP